MGPVIEAVLSQRLYTNLIPHPGTQAGDAAETSSVLESLAPTGKRTVEQPLHIGAAKANIGHGEAAAGITSLAKVLLMLKHSQIPPHCGIKVSRMPRFLAPLTKTLQTKLNPIIPDLKPRQAYIARNLTSWPRHRNEVRRVLLNNFSAAGGNTALVLEDAPELDDGDSIDTRMHHVVAVSAKTASALNNNMESLLSWIDNQENDPLTLARLSYTTTARRNHYPHRVVATGTDMKQVRDSLKKSLDAGEGANRHKGTPKCIFSFTGQGARYAGMGADLYSAFNDFRKDINRYDQMCSSFGFPSIRSMFTGSVEVEEPSASKVQLATVAMQMALCRLWKSFGVTPSAVVGHSLGEYPALYAAGVLSQADVIYLVGHRAQLLESLCEANSHAMLAVRASIDEIEACLGLPATAGYETPCFNGQRSVVLGGTKAQMEAARSKLQQANISTTPLDVPYAFHTSQVEPILDSLAEASRNVNFAEPNVAIISPTCGGIVRKAADFGEGFTVRHCRQSVKMFDALQSAQQGQILDAQTSCIEIGAGTVVANMVKEVAGRTFETFASMRNGENSWKFLSQALAKLHTRGLPVSWATYHRDFAACQRVLDLPSYSWDLKDYWIQYVHSWSLRKGEPPLRVSSQPLQSSSIHTVVKDDHQSRNGELIIEADLSRKDLHPMVQGHQVYGVPLCTPSVYADIAMTVGEHIKHQLTTDTNPMTTDICDMTIQSALVANSNGQSQILRTCVTLDDKNKTAKCTFSSVDANGKLTEQHAHCTIRFVDTADVLSKWKSRVPTVLSRMSKLKAQVNDSSNTFRFSKSMIYKMIGQLADFDPNYRGLVEITLDNDAMEATGRVSFRDVHCDGKFNTCPAYIDALSQLGGFVMNANEKVDLDKEVFVNHGWESMQLFQPIDPEGSYYSHVSMTEGKDKLWTGDVVIFDKEDNLVAVFGGVAVSRNCPYQDVYRTNIL
jgi:iterative type I PKS product template protein